MATTLRFSYGLSNAEIRAYLGSFNDTPTPFIDEVVDFAEIYRKKFKLRNVA